jgi:hypothetical protein
MDPSLEQNPIFQELHTQILAEAQAQLQHQLRPKYVARLERHLSEGGAWHLELNLASLEGKEPNITIAGGTPTKQPESSTAVLSTSTASADQQLSNEELELRKQRRIVIYVQTRPRIAVTAIELLRPSNKDAGSYGQARYLEKRSSALHGGLHWVEIDLLRSGQRPPIPVSLPAPTDYQTYIAQARVDGWKHFLFAWKLREPFPLLPIPLLGADKVRLDLGACFRAAYDRIAADDEVDYRTPPPPPQLEPASQIWLDDRLRSQGLRT